MVSPELCSMEMDELNLDDLFLGGDGDGAMGGLNAGVMGGEGGGGHGSAIAASLFADMDLDLGTIMDGIMGMEENNTSSSTDGGRAVGASGIDDFDNNSLRGMMMLDDDFMGGGVDFDDGSNNAVTGKKNSRRRSSTNSIYSAGMEAIGGVDSTITGLNRKGKRTRTARTNPHHAAAAMKQPHQRLQQSKEVTPVVQSSASPASATSVKSRRGDLSSLMLHSSRTKEAKIVHHRDSNQLDQLPKQKGEFALKQYCPEKQRPLSQASGLKAKRKQQEELRSLKLRKYEKSLATFGLSSSRTLFYPYMKLPTNELGCKIQRQKSLYPILEKFSALLEPTPQSPKSDKGNPAKNTEINTATRFGSSISTHHETDKDSVLSATTSPMSTPTNDQSKSVITLSSPIYSLFQHTSVTSSSELIEFLTNSTDAVVSTLCHHEKDVKRENSQGQNCTTHTFLSPPPSPSKLVDELVKIYLGYMKQSAFLRQNAINMENWCRDHFSSDDVRMIFSVDRKSIEQVFNVLWVHDKERSMARVQQLQQSQEQPETGGRGGRRGLGACAKTIITNPITISIAVKVKMSGWTDKSGKKLKANLACPKRWKAALERGSSAAATSNPLLDLSPFSTKTLDRAAEEMLRLDVLPLRKSSSVPLVNSSSTSVKDSLSKTTKVSKVSAVKCGSGSRSMIDIVGGKTKRRRKSKNDDIGSLTPRSRGADFSHTSSGKKNKVQLCFSRGIEGNSALIPHIPGSNKPRNARSNLTDVIHIIGGVRTDDKSSGFIHEEGQRIAHASRNSVLYPSVKPSKRRTFLGEEVSLALLRLNQRKHEQRARISLSNKTNSHAAYVEDEDCIPAPCNTVEMWKCLGNCNYFEVLETEADITKALEGLWQPETFAVNDIVNGDDGFYYWGSLPQKRFAMDKNGAKNENGGEGMDIVETKTPLFDRLQSLLVEVEDSEEVNANNAYFDDDYLVANLPSLYSPDKFINGPKVGENNKGTESAIFGIFDTDAEEYVENSAPDVLDQSVLTLDQRTYIHLCAAQLIGTKWTQSHQDFPSSLSSLSFASSHSTSITKTTEEEEQEEEQEDEHIEVIVHKMKERFYNLQDDTKSKINELRRTAAISLSSSPLL